MNEDARDPATRDDEDMEPRRPDSAQLAWLRRRLAGNDRLLGYDLERFRESQRMTEDQLASHFELDRDGLARLALSGRPRAASLNADVRSIAQRHGISDFQLRRMYTVLRTEDRIASSPTAGRTLAAARDHEGEHDVAVPALAEERATYDPDANQGETTDHRDPQGSATTRESDEEPTR